MASKSRIKFSGMNVTMFKRLRLKITVPVLCLVLIGIASLKRLWPSPFSVTKVGESYFPRPGSLMLGAPYSEARAMLLVLAYLLGTVILGTAVVQRFTRGKIDDKGLRLVLPFLGFFPGYLTVIAINRVTTLVVPKHLSLYLMLALYFAGLLWGIQVLRNYRIWRGYRESLLGGSICLSILIVFLILGVQNRSNHVIGDGAVFTFENLDIFSNLKSTSTLPVITQHYDELFFLAPLSFWTSSLRVNFYDWFWFMYAISRAGSLIYVYTASRLLKLSYKYSILLSLITMFTPLGPNPLGAPLLFDSGSNLLENLHVGRSMTISVVVLSLAFAQHVGGSLRFTQRFNLSKIDCVVLFCIGVGVSSVTTSFAIALLGVGFILLVINDEPESSFDASAQILTLFVVLAISISSGSLLIGVTMALISVLAVVWLIRSTVSNVVYQLGTKCKSFIIPNVMYVLSGAVIGFLLLGNIYVEHAWTILKLNTDSLVSRGLESGLGNLGLNPFPPTFPLEHTATLYTFLSMYGLPIALFCLCLIFRPNVGKNYPLLSQTILATLAVMILGFFVWDFMNGSFKDPIEWLLIWIKSRLVEPWFYALLVLIAATGELTPSVKDDSQKKPALPFLLSVYFLVFIFGMLPRGPIGQGWLNLKFLLNI